MASKKKKYHTLPVDLVGRTDAPTAIRDGGDGGDAEPTSAVDARITAFSAGMLVIALCAFAALIVLLRAWRVPQTRQQRKSSARV